MKVQTHLFGEVNVSEDKIITFPKGLIGDFFEGKTKFMLIHEEDKNQQRRILLHHVQLYRHAY